MKPRAECTCEMCTRWRRFLVLNRKGQYASMKAFGTTTTTTK